MTAATEAADLERIEQGLAARFVPPLSPTDVRRCLDEAVALFEGAPIRTYVVLLVERIATDRLRAAVAAAAPAVERPIAVGA